MHRLIAPLAAAAALLAVAPASATLQIAFTDGTNTFTCFDGQLGCDLAGANKDLLTLNTTVGGFFISGTLSTSSSGASNNIDLSSFSVINNGLTEGTLRMILSDTDFAPPVKGVEESASLTFHKNVGAGDSVLSFYADALNTQGAGPGLVIPGTLLDSVSGAAATDPDSFSGTHHSGFLASGLFSMTEVADLDLIAGGSITGFDQAMTTSVPEPGTWAMVAISFAAFSLMAKRRKSPRYAI